MDPLTQIQVIRCRASIITAERSLKKARYHRSPLTNDERNEALICRAFHIGQQFRDISADPFASWHHPLAGRLSESFQFGQGGQHVSAA